MRKLFKKYIIIIIIIIIFIYFYRKELLPNNIRHHRPEKEWKRELNELHSALTGVTKSEAKDMFLQYCTQLPFYGFSSISC